MVSGQRVQNLAAGEKRLVLEQRLQKPQMEGKNAKEQLQRQIPVTKIPVQLTVYGENMESGQRVQNLVAGEKRLALDQRLQKHLTEGKNVKESR